VVSIDAATKKQIERRARNRIQQRNYRHYSAARKRLQNEIELDVPFDQSVAQVDEPLPIDDVISEIDHLFAEAYADLAALRDLVLDRLATVHHR